MSLVVEGKSKKVYLLEDNILKIIYKDDISCFNKYRCQVNGKGVVLNSQNAWWMQKTKHIIPNHYLFHYKDKLFVKKCKRIDIEVVVRDYYTGSLTKPGEAEKYGIQIPEGLQKNDKFPTQIITPTTKDEFDLPLREDQIFEKGLINKKDWEYIKNVALKLFDYGSRLMLEKGVILVDTKYEFGYDEDKNIVLIDEIHTSDSSRFWIEEDSRFKSFDKDHLRNFVRENPQKEIPESIKNNVLEAYRDLYSIITRKKDLVVIMAGSKSDTEFVEKINSQLKLNNIDYVNYYHSAHKETLKVLEIIDKYNSRSEKTVFVTVAGLSNALGGVVASNTSKPVINCPPFKDGINMLLNINSSLMMPSNVPSSIIIRPDNLALFVKNIFSL